MNILEDFFLRLELLKAHVEYMNSLNLKSTDPLWHNCSVYSVIQESACLVLDDLDTLFSTKWKNKINVTRSYSNDMQYTFYVNRLNLAPFYDGKFEIHVVYTDAVQRGVSLERVKSFENANSPRV